MLSAPLSLLGLAEKLLSLHLTKNVVMFLFNSKICIDSVHFPLFQRQERNYISLGLRAETELTSWMGNEEAFRLTPTLVSI